LGTLILISPIITHLGSQHGLNESNDGKSKSNVPNVGNVANVITIINVKDDGITISSIKIRIGI
jgi:hypothetical protein